ncbi:unnamed protein product [Calicophoron daubneyi]|uniref:Caspase-3 n=1 Tax=Calicophoron daubneyi TaxID=300641 RepID=A0AAV2TSJ1_CALDB
MENMSGDDTDSKLSSGELRLEITANPGLQISQEDLNNPSLSYPLKFALVDKKPCRGICLLINQRDFLACTGQGRRDGTDVDADRIERLFKHIGYSVLRNFNVDTKRFERLLSDVAQYDHSNFESFVCVILSHGCNGIIFATDGEIPAERVVAPFKGDRCRTLVGKPKLFFIQACRGMTFDKGVPLPWSTDSVAGDVLVTKIPVESDILVVHSTVPGFYAWRNSLNGSWFIQELCRVLEEDVEKPEHHDIMTLLTVVARCVAFAYRSNTGQADSHNMTQMIQITSTLTRLMYLTKFPKP